ncbi:hypothetical protein INN71_00670 [Nocardioides sp. ChNu-153]|uniref:hypothetical protein n=1 Tax=unclassified Nocardioides TaxID=2615069 RepID=UPI002406B70E|nr:MULTISPECIES: hypothetical protein [unclassified Nocardioides]MDF9714567.1 hypothetical protein [Nocardioides sp. ChNu-99]MDN7119900.1 hypothetical protein [Nocardioides sp. ChNu-153]
MSSQPPVPRAPRKAKHLIDFSNPPAPRAAQEAEARLSRVQQWVMSVLTVTTTSHLAGGLVVAAAAIDGHLDARIGLVVIAAAVGVLGMVAGLAIHRRSPVHPLVLLGLLPALIGCYWVF